MRILIASQQIISICICTLKILLSVSETTILNKGSSDGNIFSDISFLVLLRIALPDSPQAFCTSTSGVQSSRTLCVKSGIITVLSISWRSVSFFTALLNFSISRFSISLSM